MDCIDEIRELVREAFEFIKTRGLLEDHDCLETSVNMHHYLTKRGVDVYLRRYETPFGGHWTIQTNVGEFDPTISFWGKDAPEDSVIGELYEVTSESPHSSWEIDDEMKEEDAYSCAWLEDLPI